MQNPANLRTKYIFMFPIKANISANTSFLKTVAGPGLRGYIPHAYPNKLVRQSTLGRRKKEKKKKGCSFLFMQNVDLYFQRFISNPAQLYII